MVIFPNAKINLGLNIISRREDGYHEISSVFYPVPFKDVLEITPAQQTSLKIHGLHIPGDLADNLVLKAYQAIQKDYDLPSVEINLLKAIPMGAGLGGGSADCAFMINLVNDYFDLDISLDDKLRYASELGSDCAFFIQNTPSHATGRGELLTPIDLDLSGYYLLLITPDIHVSTAAAYSGTTPQRPLRSVPEILQMPIEEWQGSLINDFEQSVFPQFSEIAKIKKELQSQGAIYASMTGSGAAVYGIFDEEPQKTSKHPAHIFEL